VARWKADGIVAAMFVRWFTLDDPGDEGLECDVDVMMDARTLLT
jgi:hypothetical protein